MRVAIISDIHGNSVALNRVLRDIHERGADQLLCLGDVATLGPDPNTTVEILKSRACPCIMGNHDEFMIEPDSIKTYTDEGIITAAVDWCRERLTPSNIDYIRTFLVDYRLDLGYEKNLYGFHGTPQSNTGVLLATTPPDELDGMFAGIDAAVAVGGHTHSQMMRRHGGLLIVNPGSTGVPFKEFTDAPVLYDYAEYAIIEADEKGVQVELRHVRLPLHDLIESVADSDNPISGWLLKEYRRMA